MNKVDTTIGILKSSYVSTRLQIQLQELLDKINYSNSGYNAQLLIVDLIEMLIDNEKLEIDCDM